MQTRSHNCARSYAVGSSPYSALFPGLEVKVRGDLKVAHAPTKADKASRRCVPVLGMGSFTIMHRGGVAEGKWAGARGLGGSGSVPGLLRPTVVGETQFHVDELAPLGLEGE